MIELTKPELDALADFGVTIREDKCVIGERVVFECPDTDTMMTLLDSLRAHEIAHRALRFNSQRQSDDTQLLTIQPRS